MRETDAGGGTDIKAHGDLSASAGGHRGLPAMQRPLTRGQEESVTRPG